MGIPHICGELGDEVPLGTAGLVYFEQPHAPFSYHGDEAKTRDSRHPVHGNWTTMGDVGYLDSDGYLYLTDRRSFMIISGGVNIYPAEIENRLILHDKVADVAVFGVPDPEMGECVQAVVQLAPGVAAGPELADELQAFMREHLAGYKVPRRIDFRAELPRLESGKLAKYLLRREYLATAPATSLRRLRVRVASRCPDGYEVGPSVGDRLGQPGNILGRNRVAADGRQQRPQVILAQAEGGQGRRVPTRVQDLRQVRPGYEDGEVLLAVFQEDAAQARSGKAHGGPPAVRQGGGWRGTGRCPA
jgi:hypothetical protein